MKAKIIITTIITLIFILCTLFYESLLPPPAEFIRFGFPWPFQETFTGKSGDPANYAERFLLFNFCLDMLVLLAAIILANVIYTSWKGHLQSRQMDNEL
jgi:hypothetical protein